MHSITAQQVTPKILSLFDRTRPTMPRAFNVLEGTTSGQILVDEPLAPTWAVVRDDMYGTLYFGGPLEAARVQSLVSYFRQIGEVGIGCWPDDPLNGMLPREFDYDGSTLYFPQRSRSTDLRQFQVPDGYRLAVRGQDLLKQSPDYKSLLDSFGTEEKILQHTQAVVILFEGRVVCEAGTGAPTHGQIEVGVTTDESHRQRGLATVACARLISLCEAQGYETWWDCAKQNLASTKLAHKLGFHAGREYRYVWWKQVLDKINGDRSHSTKDS